MPNHSSRLSVAILLAGLSGQSLADTVLLRNGDKITGEIKSFDEAHLVIKPSYSPKISIERSAIKSFETTKNQHWSINRTLQDVSIKSSELDGFVQVNNKQIPISELVYSDRKSDSEWRYSGSVEAALDVTSHSKNTQKLHAKSDITAETLQWRHNLKSEVRYETEGNATKRNTIEGHYSLDYLISEHWLLRQEDYFQEDRLDFPISNYYAAIGPGYRFWGIGRDKLDFVVTYNHFWLDTQIFTYQLNAWASTLNYKQYWFDGVLETYADLQIAFPDTPTIDYISDSTFGLKYLLTQQIYLSFKYDINETKTSIRHVRDVSYNLGLGVNF
ncbi:DUF481 domain-containing protein [Shewanella xiamenensis]|uniref:DUF481 domain-containing protein n=1 Tax=Shewanella xiamenensis TaxID=332186 RepID=UPI000DB44275|nr:DUF481 domain-containing protein [Shewanella xiamenensis]MCT8863990.1 DUF481 domain-containing protein [Shewanella xiamenensis]MCT8876195.1 DUF481 domain-containing protein [Shewanella xiamenensis]PZP37734.1 MAG: hypothetical protein DI594_02240 [Shewanella oneidensis]